MALQRLEVTTAQRMARVWDMCDILLDTDTNVYYLGDLYTLGGIEMGVSIPAGTITSVNGDIGPAIVLTPEDIFGGAAAASPANDGMAYVFNGGTWALAPAAATTTLYTGDGALTSARTANLAGFSLSFLNANMGLSIAPAVLGGSAFLRNAAGTSIGATNSGGLLMQIVAGDDLQINGAPGVAGQVLTSQGANNPPVWANALTIDLNTTVFSTGVAIGAAPVSPPGAPDTGDVHVETYTDGIVWWVWSGAAWVNTAQSSASPNLYTSDGTIPAATNRLANFPANSSLTFRGTGTSANVLVSLAGATNTAQIGGANAGLTAGGSLAFNAAAATLTMYGGTDLNLVFGATSELQISGNPGAANDVLASQGPGLPPVWLAGALDNIYTASGSVTAAATRVVTVPVGATLAFQGTSTSDGHLKFTPASDRVELTTGIAGTLLGLDMTPTALNMRFGALAPLQINGVPGNLNDVLTSQGAGAAPAWQSGAFDNLYTANGSITAATARVATVPVGATLTFQGTATSDGLLRFTPASDRVELTVGVAGTLSGLDMTPTAVNARFGGTTPLQINSDPGVAGQVLSSQGAGAPPIWLTPLPEDVYTVASDAAATALAATLGTSVPVVVHVTASILAGGGRQTRLYYGTGAAQYVVMAEPIATADQNLTQSRQLTSTGMDFSILINDGGPGQANAIFDAAASSIDINATDGTNSGAFFVDPSFTAITHSGAFGTSQVRIGNTGDINLILSATSDLNINGLPGVAGQVLTSQGPGLPPLWAAGVAQNYANANLAANASYTHSWLTFNLTENFTTGTRLVAAASGANSTQLQQLATQLSMNAVNGASTSNVTVLPVSATLQHDQGGLISNVKALNTGLDFEIDNGKDMRINNLPGTAGQVLTSQGTGLPPVWAAGAGSNYANASLTATANRTHDWSTFTQTEDFTTGQHVRQFSAFAQTFVQTENVGGLTQVHTSGASTSTRTLTNTQQRLRVEDTFGDVGEVAVSALGIDLILQTGADLSINGSPGTSGQVLTSQGNNTAPIWATPTLPTVVVARAIAAYTGPVAGEYTATVLAAAHGLGTNVDVRVWDTTTTPGSRSAFVPNSLQVNTATGDITMRVSAVPDARVNVDFVITRLA